jgi:hypothetical protein
VEETDAFIVNCVENINYWRVLGKQLKLPLSWPTLERILRKATALRERLVFDHHILHPGCDRPTKRGPWSSFDLELVLRGRTKKTSIFLVEVL